METTLKIETNRSIKKSVIKKICKENNLLSDTIRFIHTNICLEYNNVEIGLLKTSYKGFEYSFSYISNFSGVFNAYLVTNKIIFK